MSKDESVIRSQDFFTLLTYVSWNRVGEPLVWDFLRTEWDYLVQRFTLNDRLFGRFLTTATEMFTTRYDAWSVVTKPTWVLPAAQLLGHSTGRSSLQTKANKV